MSCPLWERDGYATPESWLARFRPKVEAPSGVPVALLSYPSRSPAPHAAPAPRRTLASDPLWLVMVACPHGGPLPAKFESDGCACRRLCDWRQAEVRASRCLDCVRKGEAPAVGDWPPA